jgi:2-polyprenyl-6-hydroxyphenyl methylase/3-demethylubiquinone-9 3-methyltransferase
MLRLAYDDNWPESWKKTYVYDEVEVWGSRHNLGHTYQYRARRNWSIHSIEESIPRGGEVLDVAAGGGNFTLPLAEKGYRVTWNDLRSDVADMVKRKHESGCVDFVPGNIFELAAHWAGRFDAVLAAEIIEHVAHPDEFLTCLASVLKPGGRLFLTTPNGRYFRFNLPRFSECPDPSAFESVQFKPDSDGHIFLLDREECRMLAYRAGLCVEQIFVFTNPLTRGHVKLGHLLPYLPASLVSGVEQATRKLPRVLREKLHCQMAAVLRKPDEA